ncbi:MAG TPA: hypothetical protein VGI60_03755 [Chthoniobacterales bacterium]
MAITEHQVQSERDGSLAWRPDLLLRILLLWTSLLTGIVLWLPLVRGLMEGRAYQWMFADGIGGRGIGGAYWLLAVSGVFVFSLFYFGWQGARPPFHWLLLILHGSLAIAVFYAAVNHPEELFFEGATLGARFSLVRSGPVVFGTVAGCALLWVIRDLRSHRQRSAPRWVWTRGKRVRLALVLGIIPAQIILLRSWGPFSFGAMIGVILTIWQWFIITQGLLAPVNTPGAE